jgi:hypothetical protein
VKNLVMCQAPPPSHPVPPRPTPSYPVLPQLPILPQLPVSDQLMCVEVLAKRCAWD